MPSIKITFEEGISELDAVEIAHRVIAGGRVSKNGELYCYATVIKRDSCEIAVLSNRTKNGMDTFRIYKEG